jgi:hypothetical protein
MRPGKSPVILSRTVIKITRARLIVASIAFLVVLAASLGAVTIVFAAVHGDLVLAHPNHVWVKDPVTIKFDQDVDTANVRVTLTPKTPFTLKRSRDQLIVVPKPAWLPARHYTIQLGSLPNSRHTSTLTGWHALFLTQPDVAVRDFKISTVSIATGSHANMKLTSALSIEFTRAMKPSTVVLTINKAKPAAGSLAWSTDKTAATFTPVHPLPSQSFQVTVTAGFSAEGDPMLAPAQVQVTADGLEPSNGSSGITPDFVTKTPLEIVVENSGPARPQSGLQLADMVFEYVSEYSITRMTAIYFNRPPALIGPVRSCRLINIPLNEAFYGAGMCSGVSPGTHAALPTRDNPRTMHVIINDYDSGNHFFRASFQFAPHNLFTDAVRALRWRAEENLPTPSFTIDPPHPDNGLGIPFGAPTVGLHAVNYTYNPVSQTYARFDHGTPFIDAGTHAQLHVKTIILMHTDYQVMGYVEDESGGAHSIYYGLIGSGPAEIWSDGKVIHAAWHMDLTTAPYFTDEQGNFIELNTGLTWIHVLGNGQTQ